MESTKTTKYRLKNSELKTKLNIEGRIVWVSYSPIDMELMIEVEEDVN